MKERERERVFLKTILFNSLANCENKKGFNKILKSYYNQNIKIANNLRTNLSRNEIKQYQKALTEELKNPEFKEYVESKSLNWTNSDEDGIYGPKTKLLSEYYDKWKAERITLNNVREAVLDDMFNFRIKLNNVREALSKVTNNFSSSYYKINSEKNQNNPSTHFTNVKAYFRIPNAQLSIEPEYSNLLKNYSKMTGNLKEEFDSLNEYFNSLTYAYFRAPIDEPKVGFVWLTFDE